MMKVAPLMSVMAALTACLVALPPARAQATDPLWLKAVANMETTKGQIASLVRMRIQISNSDGKVEESSSKESKLTGWKNGQPVRSISSLDNSKGGDASDANLDTGMADRPEQTLEGIVSAVRQEEVGLETGTQVVFKVSGEKLRKDKKLPFDGKVWVDKATGHVAKLAYTFDPSNVPLTKKLTQSTAFAPTPAGVWLPSNSAMDVLVSVIFAQKRIAMRYDFESWVTRP
jgi:hypothetical protein